ncbi:MAG: TadE/TadG family type IV pilus assembly protein [Pseudomonadota bacterium]
MGSVLSRLSVSARRFGRDPRGTASVEFVVSMPIFLILFGFIGGFGELVSQREHLDSAVFDATRLISQAPASWENPDGTPSVDANGKAVPSVYPYFHDEARALIAERMGIDLTSVPSDASPHPVEIATSFTEHTLGTGPNTFTFYHLEVSATVEFNAPMLYLLASVGMIDSVRPHTFAMNSQQAARYVSSIPVGSQPCSAVDRAAGLCV